jgi:hypothetical protein
MGGVTALESERNNEFTSTRRTRQGAEPHEVSESESDEDKLNTEYVLLDFAETVGTTGTHTTSLAGAGADTDVNDRGGLFLQLLTVWPSS